MNVTSEDLAMSPSSASPTSSSSTSSVLSASFRLVSPRLILPSYNLGDLTETPDLKKVHALSCLYEEPSETSPSAAAALQGMEIFWCVSTHSQPTDY